MNVLLIVYDNGAHLSEFLLNIGYLASVAREAGHKVEIYNQDIYHYPESHLTDYCELYYYAIEKGLLKDVEDFYKKHVNSDLMCVNFTSMSDDEYYKVLHDVNKLLIDDYYKNQMKFQHKVLKKLYVDRDSKFRGFRHT